MQNKIAPRKPRTGGPPERLPLDNLKNARRSLARLLQAYYRGQLDAETTRTLTFGINVLVGILKAEKEADLEKRLIEIENRLEFFGGRNES